MQWACPIYNPSSFSFMIDCCCTADIILPFPFIIALLLQIVPSLMYNTCQIIYALIIYNCLWDYGWCPLSLLVIHNSPCINNYEYPVPIHNNWDIMDPHLQYPLDYGLHHPLCAIHKSGNIIDGSLIYNILWIINDAHPITSNP